MAISNVKTAIGQDLATLTTANGYSTTITKFYKIPKMPNQVPPTECPCISWFLTNAPSRPFDEASNAFDLIYTIMIYVDKVVDTDESGDVEDALFAIYEDIVKLFNKQTTNTLNLDEVMEIQVLDIFPDTKETRGWAFIPLRITYKIN